MYLSLNSRLRVLEDCNKDFERVSDPAIHLFSGEGQLRYKGNRIEYFVDYVGEAPDGSGDKFKEPHDIAWCPATNTILASALSESEPFLPLSEPLRQDRPVAAEDLARL